MSGSKRRPGGHPARKDPAIERAYKTTRAAVELVNSLDGKITPEAHLNLRAAALGLLHVYAELTGMPAPDTYINQETP